MNSHFDKPLVSIGLPSYNRPEGLKRALEQAQRQTYQNLEIIISDNCSDDSMNIKGIVEQYMEKDSRVKFFRQQKNEGAFFNFKFLLQQATGEYFMWMADDDERDEKCVETLLQMIKKAGGAFGTYEVKNRYYNTSIIQEVPIISGDMPLYKRLFKFRRSFPSVFIYGLYKRRELDFFLNEKEGFDFMDGYFVMHVLVNSGLNVHPTEYPVVTLGINEEKYVPKPFKKSANKLLIYKPVVTRCCNIIWTSKPLNIFYKLYFISFFLLHMAKQYITYEHPHRFSAKLLNNTVRLPLRYLYRLKTRYNKS